MAVKKTSETSTSKRAVSPASSTKRRTRKPRTSKASRAELSDRVVLLPAIPPPPQVEPVVPEVSLADTILEFARPLLKQFAALPREDGLRIAVALAVPVWNAYAYAMDCWGDLSPLEAMDAVTMNEATKGEPHARAMFETLSKRRLRRFAADPRVVARWQVVTGAAGVPWLHCETTLPSRLSMLH
jgi:hypothetical protein